MLERDGRREGEGVEGKEISARSNNSTPPIEFHATWLAALGVRQEGGGERQRASERVAEMLRPELEKLRGGKITNT